MALMLYHIESSPLPETSSSSHHPVAKSQGNITVTQCCTLYVSTVNHIHYMLMHEN